jgi:hypothetical protein
MNVKFFREFDWSVLPIKKNYQPKQYDNRKLYSDNFRWVRQYRRKELCTPWRIGNELGWYVLSPIDVTIDYIDDMELTLDEKELESIHKLLGFKNLWKRDNGIIAVSNDWMKLYQFEGKDNQWETMFIPNGEGTFEWRLGFSMSIPNGYSILICPLEGCTDYTVPYGLLTEKHLSRMKGNGGISIAVKPHKKTQIRRGQSIARLILISNESLTIGHE